MKGFWPGKQTTIRPPRHSQGKGGKVGCDVCALYKGCKSPRLKPSGDFEKKVLIVTEYPGREDDARSGHLLGSSGQELRRVLRKLDVDLERDCLVTSSVRCRPPEDKEPNSKQIASCRGHVYDLIEELSPAKIVLLGDCAVESVIGGVWKKDLEGIERWRGYTIPDRMFNAWVCPTLSPLQIVKNSGRGDLELFFKEDLKRAFGLGPFPIFTKEEDKIQIIRNEQEALQYIRSVITRKPVVAFDYETTGLKPHRMGHDIICVSISEGPDHAVVFPMYESIRPTFKRFLGDRGIPKIASNKEFEELWSEVILSTEVQGWCWDTMTCAHVQDNRKHITSIKYQTYVRYGIVDYSSEIESYLKSVNEKDANSFNRIRQAPLEKLLLYCGMDSMLEMRTAQDQSKELGIAIDSYIL
jgi:uracil-DNA glycosylase family 4